MKKTILLILLLATPITAIEITEIMYNPQGADNNKEFVEIQGTNNLTNYIVGDIKQNDTLQLLKFKENSNFSLIVEKGFNYTNINASIYSAGTTIGDNLDNDDDTIYIYFNNSIITQTTYNNEFANGNGYSLEFFNNEWKESNQKGGSPGQTNLEKTNFCNIGVNIETEKQIYNKSETIRFRNKISEEDHDYIITYYITDLFNNYIKPPTNTSNHNQKSFTPVISGTEQVFILHNEITYLDCNNTNQITKSNKTIIVKGEKVKESRITLHQIDDTFEFGDTAWANINIYKGNSTKDVLYLFIEKEERITKKYKIDLETNYRDYKLSIPVSIPFNCDNKIEDGAYHLTVEGFDLIERTNLKIEGKKDICGEEELVEPEEVNEEPEKIVEKKPQVTLRDFPKEVELNKEFSIFLNITNPSKQKIEAFSYIYSGPVSLSGEREENKQATDETTELELKSTVTQIKNNSKLKIKYSIDGKVKEITKDIKINKPKEEKKEQHTYQKESYQEPANSITTNAIYESSNELSKKYGIYMFIGLLVLVSAGLAIKNGINNKGSDRSDGVSKGPRRSNPKKNARKNKVR